MSVVREVEIEKVVMHFLTLHDPDEICCNLNQCGEHEVWVMEDDMFGQVKLPRECFHYSELQKITDNRRKFYKEEEGPLYAGNSIESRPCEWNKFTKWLIKRNQKEIRELFKLDK